MLEHLYSANGATTTAPFSTIDITNQIQHPGGKNNNTSWGYYGLDISGDRGVVVVGEPSYYGGHLDGCAVHVYRKKGESYELEATLIGSDVNTFGISLGYDLRVSLDGNTIYVGASSYWTGVAPVSSGAVVIYEYQNGNWIRTNILRASPAIQLANMGSSLDVSDDGTVLVAGSPNESNYIGSCSVFRKNAGSWVHEAKLVPRNTRDTYAGSDVAISGDGSTIAVGTNSRALFVYKFDGSAWVGAQINESPSNNSLSFGSRVILSHDGTRLIVSSPQTNPASNYSGKTWIYDLTDGVWGIAAVVNHSYFPLVGACLAGDSDLSKCYICGSNAIICIQEHNWDEPTIIRLPDATVNSTNFGSVVACAPDASTFVSTAPMGTTTNNGLPLLVIGKGH